ncbi:MAG: tRNA (adenosine(37)-N6)-threonylcarbamoyltransferase complex dimerization subunit type 1 TsaB [Burkholderiales bacterium]|nr:tRNA (adenosine(37)-N6)-threonylcarbamoyltransferase complex dimerization subunit type 1 TsaB [Burkholderiales bacterium]
MTDTKLPTLLALDTSNQYCSVALQARGQVTACHEWSEQKHSAIILPMVRELLAQAKVTLADLDAIVVGVGPGGFTGVRLAVAVAQGLAFAISKPVLAHSSLEAMAVSAFALGHSEVIVAMDARMQQVYWAHYRWADGCLQICTAPSLDDVAAFTEYIRVIDKPCAVVGNAPQVFDEVAHACHQPNIAIAKVDHSAPHAAYFFTVANPAWSAGRATPPEQVQPLYVRDKVAMTIAEREAK